MTPEFKAKWLADLRTHNKAVGLLRNYDDSSPSYCCLGVACLTLGGVWGFVLDAFHDEKPRIDGRALNDGEGLNTWGLELLGITKQQQLDLISLNDEHNTFAEVIQYIELEL